MHEDWIYVDDGDSRIRVKGYIYQRTYLIVVETQRIDDRFTVIKDLLKTQVY